MSIPTVVNAAGRAVPAEINGSPVIPFKGVGKHKLSEINLAPVYHRVLIILRMVIKWSLLWRKP